ncbi:glycosyltransferase [Thalassotalea euphylliae]|uniref:Glycosyltransferase n=1 Tax=Thalassotalea euphylliae TaxID=1655234 RepID=A0A3E0TTX8_9GAMM|nr:glycosyltransferase [Thalassotalea euphylliae]REL28008.1 glycosyltransferase [Thalassotalea euphylliae]
MTHVNSEHIRALNHANEQQTTRVLYVHFGDNWLRGSEIVLLDVINNAQQQGYQPVLWCNSQVLADQAEQLGIEVVCQPMVCLGYWLEPKWQVIAFINQLLTARKLITKHNIALVHCNNGAPCQWLSVVCKWLKVPLVLHLHARYQYFDRLALVFAGADHTIGVSQSVIQVFSRTEPNHSAMSVIYNGVEQQRAVSNRPKDLRALVGARQNDTVLLFVGSLIARKGVATLIAAVAQLSSQQSPCQQSKGHKVKLAIVGEGEEKLRLQMQVESLGLTEHVYFLGEQQDVAALYGGNADCFVSVPDEEVFGLTLAEASLAGMPVITTDVPGVNEIYQNNVSARLVPAGSVDALARAMSELERHPQRFKRFATEAQRHIAQSFSCQQQFQQLDACYQDVLTRGSQKSLVWLVRYQISQMTSALVSRLCSKLLTGLKHLGVLQATAK